MKKKPNSLYVHPARKKSIQRPEQRLQIAVFNFLRPLMDAQQYKQFVAFHVPNGGKRTKAEAGIFKAMGVMAGVADICLLLPCVRAFDESIAEPPHVCWIEMKAGKGSTTDNQDAFGVLMDDYGFDYRVLAADSESEAVTIMQGILREYGVKC